MSDFDFDVFLKGSYGPSNIGDDILMISCANIIKKAVPSDRIAIGIEDIFLAKKLLPDVSFIEHRADRNISARSLIYGGGGQFFSFSLSRRKRGISLYISKIPMVTPALKALVNPSGFVGAHCRPYVRKARLVQKEYF